MPVKEITRSERWMSYPHTDLFLPPALKSLSYPFDMVEAETYRLIHAAGADKFLSGYVRSFKV